MDKRMRFLIEAFLFLVIIGSLSYSYYVWNRGPCYRPIEYSVETFSDRFGISKAEFLKAVGDAEAVWEKEAGRDLFSPAPKDARSDLAINLIYDERQATADKNKTLEAGVDQATSRAETVGADFDSEKRQYEVLNSSYKADVVAYESALKAFNASVDYWNSRGGAPEKQYEALQAESERLKAMQGDLERKRLEVNRFVDKLNALAAEYNRLISAANSNIDVINQSADKEFEQGEYISDRSGRRINIYEYTSKPELERVLAHELGHALGIEHNSDPESIMYYLNSGSGMQLSKEDLASLVETCKLVR